MNITVKNYGGQAKKAMRFASWVKDRSKNCPPGMYECRIEWEKLLNNGGIAAVTGALCVLPKEYGRGG